MFQVIDELDEALMQIGDATGSEQHGEYDERMHEQEKQDGTVQQDVGLHMVNISSSFADGSPQIFGRNLCFVQVVILVTSQFSFRASVRK